jgi:hypothetical protein
LRTSFYAAIVAIPIRYSSAVFETAKDRSMTAWINEKFALVPPIPKASVNMAAEVKTGEGRNWCAV